LVCGRCGQQALGVNPQWRANAAKVGLITSSPVLGLLRVISARALSTRTCSGTPPQKRKASSSACNQWSCCCRYARINCRLEYPRVSSTVSFGSIVVSVVGSTVTIAVAEPAAKPTVLVAGLAAIPV
jgi:hypothetical protein